MKIQEIKEFIAKNIQYKDWTFFVNEKGGVIYVQIQFEAPDNFNGGIEVQHCRKWQLSEWMTPTEIVQTCWAAVKRAELHEAAEHFRFKGADIFNTHIDVEALAEVCTGKRYEHRGDVNQDGSKATKNPKEIHARITGHIRDGGTIHCEGKDGKSYFIDHRISSKTKGKVYDRYPSDGGAQILDVVLLLAKE